MFGFLNSLFGLPEDSKNGVPKKRRKIKTKIPQPKVHNKKFSTKNTTTPQPLTKQKSETLWTPNPIKEATRSIITPNGTQIQEICEVCSITSSPYEINTKKRNTKKKKRKISSPSKPGRPTKKRRRASLPGKSTRKKLHKFTIGDRFTYEELFDTKSKIRDEDKIVAEIDFRIQKAPVLSKRVKAKRRRNTRKKQKNEEKHSTIKQFKKQFSHVKSKLKASGALELSFETKNTRIEKETKKKIKKVKQVSSKKIAKTRTTTRRKRQKYCPPPSSTSSDSEEFPPPIKKKQIVKKSTPKKKNLIKKPLTPKNKQINIKRNRKKLIEKKRPQRKKSIVNRKKSIANRKKSIITQRKSTTNRKKSIVGRRKSIAYRKKSIAGRKKSIANRKKSIVSQKQKIKTPSKKKPPTSKKIPKKPKTPSKPKKYIKSVAVSKKTRKSIKTTLKNRSPISSLRVRPLARALASTHSYANKLQEKRQREREQKRKQKIYQDVYTASLKIHKIEKKLKNNESKKNDKTKSIVDEEEKLNSNQVVDKTIDTKNNKLKQEKLERYVSVKINDKLCVFVDVLETEKALLKLKYHASKSGLYNNLRGRVNSHVGLKFSWIVITKKNKEHWEKEVESTKVLLKKKRSSLLNPKI